MLFMKSHRKSLLIHFFVKLASNIGSDTHTGRLESGEFGTTKIAPKFIGLHD